jgi:4-hydroxythreonine-4-phosphate dehydrogenase
VTGPISKERLQKGGFHYAGHTEFLAHLCGLKQDGVTMMLANSQLRVSLVTTHISLQNVSKFLTKEKISQTVLQTVEGLKLFWGIEKPKIAILSLNPHAGENGLFGDEEIKVIRPTLENLKNLGETSCFEIEGPFPADTFFAHHISNPKFDAVVCMYHDQGLIPVKLIDFQNTINVTLGLPIIRTSVDHGVGFDIAGKNRADPSSLLAAIQAAMRMLNNKKVRKN